MSEDDNAGTQDSSSTDDGGANQSVPPPSEDDISSALASAFQSRDIPVDDDGVKVTTADGLYHLMVRLTADARPLPQVPDDTSTLAPGSVQGAQLMVLGTVQLVEDQTRVTMRTVVVETSEIVESSSADASGVSADSIQGAAEDCLAGLPSLGAR